MRDINNKIIVTSCVILQAVLVVPYVAQLLLYLVRQKVMSLSQKTQRALSGMSRQPVEP